MYYTKFIKYLKSNDTKKILIVGNKPLDHTYSTVIDSYDIVIRFNMSYYLINTDEEYRQKYGKKIDFLFLNEPLKNCLMYNVNSNSNYQKIYGTDVLRKYTKCLIDNPVKIIGFKKKNFNMHIQPYELSINESDLPKFSHELINFINKKYDTKFRYTKCFTVGTFMIFLLLFHNINFDIIGFSTNSELYLHSYAKLIHTLPSATCVLNDMGKISKLKCHDIDNERFILNYLLSNNHITSII